MKLLLPKSKDYSALVGKRPDPVALLPNMKLMPKNDIFPEGQEAFINSKEFFISAIFIVHLKSASCNVSLSAPGGDVHIEFQIVVHFVCLAYHALTV